MRMTSSFSLVSLSGLGVGVNSQAQNDVIAVSLAPSYPKVGNTKKCRKERETGVFLLGAGAMT